MFEFTQILKTQAEGDAILKRRPGTLFLKHAFFSNSIGFGEKSKLPYKYLSLLKPL